MNYPQDVDNFVHNSRYSTPMWIEMCISG